MQEIPNARTQHTHIKETSMNEIPASFQDILDEDSSQTERPKPLPTGSYHSVVIGAPRYDKSSKKQTRFVEFTLKIIAVGDDVDMDALMAMGGYQDKTIRATYYLTEDAMWRLKEFLQNLGLPDGKYSHLIPQATNRKVGIVIRHTPSDDNTGMFANVGRTFAID